MARERIYLDYNATTPTDPRVVAAMLPYFTEFFGNAASVDHDYGREAKFAVDEARGHLAAIINAKPEEIIFTSGATESNNLALLGVAERYTDKGDHFITSVTEHKAILDTCQRLESLGKKVTYLPVDSYGMVNPNSVRQALTPRTVLISIMAANNEIGTINPLKQIGAIAREHGVLFHSDATQAVGHIPIDIQAHNIDLLSFSAHKIYGPKGVGALYRRRSNPHVKLAPLIYGGNHERGLRSGTLPVPLIVGFGEALKIAKKEMASEAERDRRHISQLWQQIKSKIEDVELNGHPSDRLPHNLNISVSGIESRAVIVKLTDVALATGSACTSATVEPSHVIAALGYGEERAHNALRLSVGRLTTSEQIEQAANSISDAVRELRLLLN